MLYLAQAIKELFGIDTILEIVEVHRISLLSAARVVSAAAMALGCSMVHAQDRVTVGAGVAAVPTYQGADDYRVLPFPLLDIKIGQFFANFGDGVGVNVIDTPEVQFGGSVTFVRGYRKRDVPEGIDKLSDAAGGRMFARVNLGGVNATVGATRSFGGTDGTVVDARLAYPLRVSERIFLIPSLSTSWANAKHMDGYFGVSAREASASALTAYRASSGFKDVSAGLIANYRLGTRTNLTASAGVTRLFDKAADSPFVERRWQPSGFMGVSYSF